MHLQFISTLLKYSMCNVYAPLSASSYPIKMAKLFFVRCNTESLSAHVWRLLYCVWLYKLDLNLEFKKQPISWQIFNWDIYHLPEQQFAMYGMGYSHVTKGLCQNSGAKWYTMSNLATNTDWHWQFDTHWQCTLHALERPNTKIEKCQSQKRMKSLLVVRGNGTKIWMCRLSV